MLHYRLPCSCLISFPLTHTSLFMFHLISFSSHFIHHSPFHSFHLPLVHLIHLIHIYLIWLHSYYMVIQPYCQFHFSANPVSGSGGFTTPCLFILNKKYNRGRVKYQGGVFFLFLSIKNYVTICCCYSCFSRH